MDMNLKEKKGKVAPNILYKKLSCPDFFLVSMNYKSTVA